MTNTQKQYKQHSITKLQTKKYRHTPNQSDTSQFNSLVEPTFFI